MYPEDRVLVTYLPKPSDFEICRQEGWYRIPQKHAPKGLFAEYYAFYLGRAFGDDKWTIRYYASRLGHELLTREDLLPAEPGHPRAKEYYYKIQLGPIKELVRPIVSLNWRRITFIHTTWDRFQDATEINDLFVEGGDYVDRQQTVLKESVEKEQRKFTVVESRHQHNHD